MLNIQLTTEFLFDRLVTGSAPEDTAQLFREIKADAWRAVALGDTTRPGHWRAYLRRADKRLQRQGKQAPALTQLVEDFTLAVGQMPLTHGVTSLLVEVDQEFWGSGVNKIPTKRLDNTIRKN